MFFGKFNHPFLCHVQNTDIVVCMICDGRYWHLSPRRSSISSIIKPFRVRALQTRFDGQKTALLRPIHCRLPFAQEDEASPWSSPRTCQTHWWVHRYLWTWWSIGVVHGSQWNQGFYWGWQHCQRPWFGLQQYCFISQVSSRSCFFIIFFQLNFSFLSILPLWRWLPNLPKFLQSCSWFSGNSALFNVHRIYLSCVTFETVKIMKVH